MKTNILRKIESSEKLFRRIRPLVFDVLVIDDNVKTRIQILDILAEAGIILTAGADCLKTMLHIFSMIPVPPRLIITDYQMPNENGAAVRKEVQKRYGSDLPVILLTGFQDIPPEILSDFHKVIYKPKNEGLLEVVNKILKRI